MQAINLAVQAAMDSKYLVLEIDGILRRVAYMDGKKSYMCILAKKQAAITWTRDAPVVVSGDVELKIRGA